jgi:chemotaxis protein MotB
VSGGGGHGGGEHGKRRGGHDEEHEEHENHERWLVSYADMMTLLMVLFIVMFAISQVDSRKFMALKNGLESGFGSPLSMLDGADALLGVGGHIAPDQENLPGRAGNANADPQKDQGDSELTAEVNPEIVADLVNRTNKAAVRREVDRLKEARKRLEKALAAAGMAKGASFRFDERGLVASIATDKVLYASGSATLLPRGRKIIDALAPALKKLPNKLEIDGHTDSNPISTAQFPSNWELSGDRASGVLRYLASAHKIPYSRLSSGGFADTRPVKKGKDPASFAANRRVEIVVIARVDNSLGNAVEALGNSTAVDAGATGSPSPTTAPHPEAAATKHAKPSPTRATTG